MNPDRAIAVILGLSLAVVLALGVWLLQRAHRPSEPPPPGTPTATPSPLPPAAPSATPGAAALLAQRYRLAGTVVGDLSYAIIEDPNGVNQLYRPGQIIPGLGEVSAIEADRITLVDGGTTLILQLAPAPTTTSTLRRAEPDESSTPSVVTPAPRRRRDQSRSESSP
jgi:Type II secretion system protein C